MTLVKKIIFGAMIYSSYGMASDNEFENQAPRFTIDRITHGGSACPFGSVSKNVSEDESAFAIYLDETFIEAGKGISPRFGRKNCSFSIENSYTNKWQFAIKKIDLRGSIYLEEGMALDIRMHQYFGPGPSVKILQKYADPIDGSFHETYEISALDRLWSDCRFNRNINLDFSLRVVNSNRRDFPESYGSFELVDQYGSPGSINFGLEWRRCS